WTTVQRIEGAYLPVIRSERGSYPACAVPARMDQFAWLRLGEGLPDGSQSLLAPATRSCSPVDASGSVRPGSRPPAWHVSRPREGRTKERFRTPRMAERRTRQPD